VYAVNKYGVSNPSLPSEPYEPESALIKSLGIPIAGGIILGLVFLICLIFSFFYCKNNEKLCWAREGGGPTTAREPSNTQLTTDAPKGEPIKLEQSSSGYVETQPTTTTPQETTQEV